MIDRLHAMKGVGVTPSEANFFLMRVADANADPRKPGRGSEIGWTHEDHDSTSCCQRISGVPTSWHFSNAWEQRIR